MNIATIFLPTIVLIVIIYALYKKVDILKAFKKGAQEGYQTALSLFPTILIMMLAVNIFTKSNILTDLFNHIKTIFNISKFPIEVMPLAFLKPISGSTSLVLLNDILNTYHPDSYIGILSSIIAGSTDTTIYIIATYYGSVGIKKTSSSLKIGLLTDLFTVIIALLVTYLLFQ